MRPHEMDVWEAQEDLERNGSSQDPIIYEGRETTPEDLQGGGGWASKVRIRYYGGNDWLKLRSGTLSGMVADRRKLHAQNEREAQEKASEELQASRDRHRQEVEDLCCDPHMPLVDWLSFIADLIKIHGSDATLYTDGGYNNVELRIKR